VPTAPRPASSPRAERDLLVIPEAREPRRWGLIAAIVAGVLALILIVALAAYAIDQRDRADALDAQVASAIDDQDALLDTVATSQARVAALEEQVATLEGDLRRARQGKDVANASRQEARANLRDARDRLEQEQALLRSYLGPEVSDGPHTTRLVAVGADQSPARVTLDLGRWFTGQAATNAAIADGAIAQGQRVPRYFRNDDTAWRTLPLDPAAVVTVRRWNGSDTSTIALSELQRLMRTSSSRASRITSDPFRIVVTDGRVTALTQLRYP
jgi:hypothetical protein